MTNPTRDPADSDPCPDLGPEDEYENMTVYLAAKAKRGDMEALAELREMHLPWLKREVGKRIERGLRAALDTQDILQEGFPAIARQIEHLDIRDEKGVRNWLLKISLRTLNDRRKHEHADKRDRKRQEGMFWQRSGEGGSEAKRELEQQETRALSRLAKKELREKIDDEKRRLTREQQEILHLRDDHGMSWMAIQERLGAESHGAVRVKYHRAWQRVRDAVLRRYDSSGGA